MNDKKPHGGDSLGDVKFDADRAAQLRTTVLGSFHAKARQVERRLWIWLVVFMVLACVMVRKFFEATDTQAQILWAMLFLVMFESTILMKLWYWIVHTRLGTQRELRLLRCDLAANKESLHGLEELSQLESPLRPAGLSKWERRAWKVALLVLAFGVATGGDFRFLRCIDSGAVFENVIRLQADGNGQEAARWTYSNRRKLVLREVPLYGGPAIAQTEFISASESCYRDSMGRSLAIRREPAGENRRDVIQLIDPVPFGSKAEIHWTRKVQAIHEDDVWIYKLGPGNRYRTTVELPPGAELVSVEPPENSRVMEGDRLSLKFRVSTSPDKLVSYRIKYRLPTPPSAPSASQK